jgi:hypothetical protein
MGIVVLIAAIAGPIMLALMGVGVTVWPPTKSMHHWIWGIAFIIIAILTIMSSVKQQHDSDSVQRELAQKLEGLQNAIKALTKPLLPKRVKPIRNPDSVYQNGIAVGTVIAPRITLNESKIYFEEIQNATNLDRSSSFEYRDFVLRIISARAYIGMLITPNGVATGVYRNVVCEIIGRVR